MKTFTVTSAQPELRKLVEEVFGGAEIIIAYGDKKVKLERYEPSGGAVDFDLEEDSSGLEAELLKAVRGSLTPYSRQNLEALAERARREKAACGLPSADRSSSSLTLISSSGGMSRRQAGKSRGATCWRWTKR